MLIDVANPASFPQEAIKNIELTFRNLPDSVKNELYKREIKHDSEAVSILESLFSPSNPGASELYDNLDFIFNKHDFLCYHATRITHTTEFDKEGLREFSWNRYEKNLSQFFHEKGLDENAVGEVMDLIRHEEERKYASPGHPHRTCFFTPFSNICSSNDRLGYDQFIENIGGEIARFALRDKMPEVFSLLKSNGKPVVVKVSVEYRRISEWDKRRILYHFIIATLSRIIWNYNYDLGMDFSVNGDIGPNNILDEIYLDNPDK